MHGHEEVVELLLRRRADVDAQMRWGETPLLLACQKGHERIVEILILHRANVNLKKWEPCPSFEVDRPYYTIFLFVFSSSEFVSIIPRSQGDSALYMAAGDGRAAVVRSLIRAMADIHSLTRGESALQRATGRGHAEVVSALMDAKAMPYEEPTLQPHCCGIKFRASLGDTSLGEAAGDATSSMRDRRLRATLRLVGAL
mmetsp:Transcript_55821/g.147564  ORF Transcript_55821/g.147564 Transcript_55821/m.147564 type:complete len:199 (+) Transcript_55821:461-1057(+)